MAVKGLQVCVTLILLSTLGCVVFYEYYVDINVSKLKTFLHNSVDIVPLYGAMSLGNGTKYAVITASTPPENGTYSYVFYLPLTVFAWKRIGYDTIVILVGTELEWTSNKVLHLILKYLERCSTVKFIDAKLPERILFSQVVRIFVPCMLNPGYFSPHDSFVIGDADLWVLDGSLIPNPNRSEIVSLNAECCGTFLSHDVTYQMIPMCHVIGSVSSWKRMIEHIDPTCPKSNKSIMDLLSRDEFTAYFVDNKTGSEPKLYRGNWFSDQIILSIMVQKYRGLNGTSVTYIPRPEESIRIDRSKWFVTQIGKKIDVHLLKDGYLKWRKLLPILAWMHGRKSKIYKHIMRYHRQFMFLMGLL